jgi:hypothetical protein
MDITATFKGVAGAEQNKRGDYIEITEVNNTELNSQGVGTVIRHSLQAVAGAEQNTQGD